MVRFVRQAFSHDGTLPGLIDFRAQHDSEASFAIFPCLKTNEGTSSITFLEFSRACHRFAHIVAQKARPGETVALIATTDTILYVTALAGFVYAGITVFPISPRNSPAAVMHMLRKVSSRVIMTTSSHLQPFLVGMKQELEGSVDDYAISIMEFPELSELYPFLAQERKEHPCVTFDSPADRRNLDTTVLYLHSSGSTGFPKPIPYTVRMIVGQRYGSLNVELGNDPRDIVFGTMALPSFHAMGLYSQLLYPLFTGRPTAIFAPQHPHLPMIPSPSATLQAIKQTKSTIIFVVPSFYEAWAQDPEAISVLRTLYLAVFAGGPLATGVGDALVSAGVRLGPIYGGTEFAVPTQVIPTDNMNAKDWQWLRFSSHTKPRFIDLGDGQFELQLLSCETHTLCVEDVPDVRGYATKDIWVPHPTRDGLWRIVGRVDDVIMLANGEKTVPGPMENTIMSSSLLQGAVMFGREKFQVGILVEPSPAHAIDTNDAVSVQAFRDAVWPEVQRANEEAPAFSRILKEMILITKPDKPLPRLPKGTVQRKLSLSLYSQEIEDLYHITADKSSDLPSLTTWTVQTISHWLLQVSATLTDGKKIDPSGDLFEQGFDSLTVTALRSRILAMLRTIASKIPSLSTVKVPDDVVYTNPTITLLAQTLYGFSEQTESKIVNDRERAIKAMVDKYSLDMQSVQPTTTIPLPPLPTVVLITGSTGGLGSEMLAKCLMDEAISRIYVLNRLSKTGSSKARHLAIFKDRGLDGMLLQSSKIVFLEGDAGRDWLGLPYETYNGLRYSVTVIIHNAWRLDFNLSLQSFEPQIRGTRHLLDLALSSPHAAQVRVLFMSSIAATQSWLRELGPVPEEHIAAAYAVGGGYGESKFVCEQLLGKARENGLQTTSFRIGQITGSQPRGAWATSDWFPILVKSSINLGCLPDAVGMVSWLPFNEVAEVVLNQVRAESSLEISHVVHPAPSRWTDLLQKTGNALKLPLVPFTEWYEQLLALFESSKDGIADSTPAVKLLPFFNGLAAADAIARGSVREEMREAIGLADLAISKTLEANPSFTKIRPVSEEDILSWLAYWRERGFLLK